MGANSDRHEPPIELRFIDLFMIIIAALVLITVPLLLQGISRDRPPQIVSKVVPAAMRHEQYRVTLAAAGGVSPLAWRVAEGALPRGLSLRQGRIEGTPVEAGSKRIILELRDARGGRDRTELAIDVLDFILPEQKPKQLAVEVEEVVLAGAVSGQDYEEQLTAKGGVLPHSWRVTEGRLPPGLALDSQGRLSGVPRGEDLPVLWMLFARQSARQQRLRESNSFRFEAGVTDRAGQRRQQGVTVFVEPAPRSFFWQLFLGEFVSPVGWLWRTLSWVVRIVFFIGVGLACLVALVPLGLFVFGFSSQEVQGWRGALWRPEPESEREVSPPVAAIALVIRGILNFIDKIIHFRFEVGTGSGGCAQEQQPEPVPDPELPVGLAVVGIGGEGGNGGGGGSGDQRIEDDDYLKNSWRGGVVRRGGAFLGLSFVRRADLAGSLTEAFRPLPEVGRGILHTALDRFFRHLLVLRAGRDPFGALDGRFDVVLGRKGPAPADHEARGGAGRNFQGHIVLPSELDGDAHRPDQLQDMLDAVTDLDRLRLQACGVAMCESVLQQIAFRGAAEQLGSAMEDAAARARQWMIQLVLEATGTSAGESALLRILRSSAHVRLEAGILHVRLMGLARTRHRRAAAALCRCLNACDPRTLPPHELPVRFSLWGLGSGACESVKFST